MTMGRSLCGRNTKVREALLCILQKTQQPFTVSEILTQLRKQGFHTNKTTVYRQMEKMQQQHLVQEVTFPDAIRRFEISGIHHHHLVCQHCHKIFDIILNNDLHQEEKMIFQKQKFKVLSHSLEFFGLCQHCQ